MDTYTFKSIKKAAVYDLKQSGALANKMLPGILSKEGYYKAKHTNVLWWMHKTKKISLVMTLEFESNTIVVMILILILKQMSNNY